MASDSTLENLDTFKPHETREHEAKLREVIRTQPWKAIWPPVMEGPPKQKRRYPAKNKLPNVQASFGYNDASDTAVKDDSIAEKKE